MEIITRKEAIEQGLKRYFTGKPCKLGHVEERLVSGKTCLMCASTHSAKYRKSNIEKCIAREHKYREENKEAIREKKKANYNPEYYKTYYSENRESLRSSNAEYRRNNREKVLKISRDWKKANPMQSVIRASLARINSASNGVVINQAEVELNYTQQEFINHIESLWLDGMSWENRSEWHIDHIKPIAQFIKEGETDPAIINALSNLQPLWAKDNLSKGAKYNGKN